ncbi:protein TonB [Echinicola pacifica]|uniref:Protein TonB n=2 Tax=Echinicola pacifica TaxID=346377 RepID=A0A918Q9I0_9BACT|nr:protein TonB [Echinicola pacifica]
MAFEFRSYRQFAKLEIEDTNSNFADLIDIPITVHMPPSPPLVELPLITTIPDDKVIIDKISTVIDLQISSPQLTLSIPTAAPKEDLADEVKDFVEKMPAPIGGMEAWNRYLQANLIYPRQARNMGIEGTVFLVFIVNKDGSLQDIEILRGIAGGCSEEALRVLKNAPNWEPGKQGSSAVRVKMRIPIRFRLQ